MNYWVGRTLQNRPTAPMVYRRILQRDGPTEDVFIYVDFFPFAEKSLEDLCVFISCQKNLTFLSLSVRFLCILTSLFFMYEKWEWKKYSLVFWIV